MDSGRGQSKEHWETEVPAGKGTVVPAGKRGGRLYGRRVAKPYDLPRVHRVASVQSDGPR